MKIFTAILFLFLAGRCLAQDSAWHVENSIVAINFLDTFAWKKEGILLKHIAENKVKSREIYYYSGLKKLKDEKFEFDKNGNCIYNDLIWGLIEFSSGGIYKYDKFGYLQSYQMQGKGNIFIENRYKDSIIYQIYLREFRPKTIRPKYKHHKKQKTNIYDSAGLKVYDVHFIKTDQYDYYFQYIKVQTDSGVIYRNQEYYFVPYCYSNQKWTELDYVPQPEDSLKCDSLNYVKFLVHDNENAFIGNYNVNKFKIYNADSTLVKTYCTGDIETMIGKMYCSFDYLEQYYDAKKRLSREIVSFDGPVNWSNKVDRSRQPYTTVIDYDTLGRISSVSGLRYIFNEQLSLNELIPVLEKAFTYNGSSTLPIEYIIYKINDKLEIEREYRGKYRYKFYR